METKAKSLIYKDYCCYTHNSSVEFENSLGQAKGRKFCLCNLFCTVLI